MGTRAGPGRRVARGAAWRRLLHGCGSSSRRVVARTSGPVRRGSIAERLTGRQQSVSLPRLRLGVAWENGFQHSGSRWFADTEEVTLTEPEDPRRVTGQLSETERFCDNRHSPVMRRPAYVQN